jgi:hypothetical protein
VTETKLRLAPLVQVGADDPDHSRKVQ